MGPIMSFPLRGRKAGVWASMGPGCFYPGNNQSVRTNAGGPTASMGPGCFYPGNRRALAARSERARGFNGAGMFLSRKYDESIDPETVDEALQWGRDVSIPEMAVAVNLPIQFIGASMGPGCFYPGNKDSLRKPPETERLQWGRDVSIPEISRPRRRRSRSTCFNGAGMFLSRKCCCLVRCRFVAVASMGPGCFYPGNQG